MAAYFTYILVVFAFLENKHVITLTEYVNSIRIWNRSANYCEI